MPILRDQSGNVTAIICSRPKRCSYCEKQSVKLCDYKLDSGKTCDAPMCVLHTWSPDFDTDYCRIHRRKMQEPVLEEKRKAELAAKKRDTLIFFAHSKYAGYCREKDCGAKWQEGDQMYWDSKTKEVFCAECGELMQ
jgi:hypothetical protein